MSRLQEFYTETAVPQLKEKLQLSNVMQVPRITKITLNMGVGEAIADRKIVDKAMGDLELIAGQKPVMRRARKSVATFKLRDGLPIGCMVTLRGALLRRRGRGAVHVAHARNDVHRPAAATTWRGGGSSAP